MPNTLKPGNTAKHSGLYERIGQRGGASRKFIVIEKNETVPPTAKPGETYKLVKKTSK